MNVTAGIVCQKDGFGCTVIDGAGAVTDHDIVAPANLIARGEALVWILDEARRLLMGIGSATVRVQKAGRGKFGASAERHEVEAAVQMAAVRVGTGCEMLNRDQVRAALGVASGAGAYKMLLQRGDVKVRSNEVRRDQYLLALVGRS